MERRECGIRANVSFMRGVGGNEKWRQFLDWLTKVRTLAKNTVDFGKIKFYEKKVKLFFRGSW